MFEYESNRNACSLTWVNRIAHSSTSGLTGELPHFISEKCELKGTGAVRLPIRSVFVRLTHLSSLPSILSRSGRMMTDHDVACGAWSVTTNTDRDSQDATAHHVRSGMKWMTTDVMLPCGLLCRSGVGDPVDPSPYYLPSELIS
jgi:hypothetical protein